MRFSASGFLTRLLFLFCLLTGTGCSKTLLIGPYFTNPLLGSGPDPWVIYKDVFYYFTKTSGNKITVFQTEKMSTLGKAQEKLIWTPPLAGPYSHDIWAPEIHYLNNKWYVYFAADSSNDLTHRIYVLESSDPTPYTTNWTFKGQLTPTTDRWAIDPTIMSYKNKLYCIWSGWKANLELGQQQLYIAKMKDPFTIDSDRVMISKPTYTWEKSGSPINEGPEILQNSSQDVFLIYSANSCNVDDYCLGMLSLRRNGDPLNPADWTKSSAPVFSKNTSGNTYGTRHCTFFKSVDGKDDWIIYHANSLSGLGCRNSRNPRMQKFSWNSDGTPNFGRPVAAGKQILNPSGE